MSRLDLQTFLPVPYVIGPPYLGVVAQGSQAFAVATFAGANRAIYLPVSLAVTKLVKSVSVWCTTTGSGTFDLGIYDGLMAARLLSLGSTSLVAASINTWTLTTPFLMEAGVRYYFGMSCSTASATFLRIPTPVNSMRAAAASQQGTAHPLPSPPTPAQISSAYWPAIGLDFEQ